MGKEKEKIMSINNLIAGEGCFDLQFRQDTKHDRLNSPTYYRWKAQFVITQNIANKNILEKVKTILKCGKIHLIKDRARYSVQNLDEIKSTIIPYFKSHPIFGTRKSDFNLWARAVDIIHKNKRTFLSAWKKEDLGALLRIQKEIKKFKKRPKNSKWSDMAESFAKIP